MRTDPLKPVPSTSRRASPRLTRVLMQLTLMFAGPGLGCAQPRGTIGALLVQQPGRRLLVREVPPGLGAAQAGIQEGDEVLSIDGRDPRSMSAEEVHRTLAGEVGEPIKLTLIRNNQVVRVEVRRTPATKRRPAAIQGTYTQEGRPEEAHSGTPSQTQQSQQPEAP